MREDTKKRDTIENFGLITQRSAKLKILVKVLGKSFSLVVDNLIGEAQTCSIPTTTIHDVFFMQYIVERMGIDLARIVL